MRSHPARAYTLRRLSTASVGIFITHALFFTLAALAFATRVSAQAPSTPVVATPVISLSSGSYSGPKTVTITDATPGAVLYYTTNGAVPTPNSPASSGQITISRSGTLVVMATLAGSRPSYAWATYSITSVPDSFLYTVAGSTLAGYGGDGGLATEAMLNYPGGTAVDKSGNLYIADTFNNEVRKVNAATGIITSVAGTGIAGYSGDNGPATGAQLAGPNALALDSSGNLYISEQLNQDVRKVAVATGVITTFAGSPTATTPGDGGPASSAQLQAPTGIAIDSSGNLYISGGARIREVDAKTLIIRTVAGGGIAPPQYGGLAVNVVLGDPAAVAVDSAANIYIADEIDQVVWMVTSSTGNISIFAGIFSSPGYAGDGGPATSASLNYPNSLAIDSSGNVYIGDQSNYAIRKVAAATGLISTMAGNASHCFAFDQDGVAATSADVCMASGMSVDGTGNLYYSDSNRVKEITALGTPPAKTTADPVFSVPSGTYAGPQSLTITDPTPGASIYVGIVSAPASSYVVNQNSIATGSEGYHGPISVTGNSIVTAIAVAPGYTPSPVFSSAYTITLPSTTIITNVAGNGFYGFSGAGGPATSAELGSPRGMAMDAAGNVYFADDGNNVVWKIDAGSGNISIVAGTGHPGYSGDNGPATSAQLDMPEGVAVDAKGNLFITDSYNCVVREVVAGSGNIVTFAGDGSPSYSQGDGGPATSATIPFPLGIAIDKNGKIYVVDEYSVREIDLSSGIIQTVAGGPIYIGLGDGGPATAAFLLNPQTVAFDSSGNLYIADQGNGRVRKVDAGIISTVAGNGNPGTSGDGLVATQAEVNPYAIAVDGTGNLYILGSQNSGGDIRIVDAKSGIISSIGGNGYTGDSGDGGPASMATMCPNSGLLLDPQSNLYFTDICGFAVRKLTFSAPAPAPTFDPPTGSYTGPQSVAISEAAPNATIYYTTDGSTPTSASPTYSGPISVTQNKTIQAIAVSSGYGQSAVGSAAYTILPAAPAITWPTPAPITYGTALTPTQLDAATTAPGTITYSPAAGTVLAAGMQKLTATFIPDPNSGYAATTASVTLTVNPATPAIALTSSQSPSAVSQAVTFTTAVTFAVGTPTGSVTFFDGTTQLGSATLAAGLATLTTSTLALGDHSITAQYSGDSNFGPVTSSLVQTVSPFAIGILAGTSSTATIAPGGIANYILLVVPPVPSPVALSITGMPFGVFASFSPNSLPAGAGATTVELLVRMPAELSAVPSHPSRGQSGPYNRVTFAFGFLLLPLLGMRKSVRGARRLLLFVLLGIAGVAATSALSGCSHNFPISNNNPPPPGTYTLTVTATAGTQTQSTTLTLKVE